MGLVGAAHAEVPNPGVATIDHWYGWQILVSGGASFGVAGLGGAIDNDATPAFVVLGAAGYVFGGPINHWARGHVGKGFASLGLNVGCPLVMGLIVGGVGALSGSSNAAFGDGEAEALYIGVPLGALTAVLIDAIVLGHEDVQPGGVAFGIGPGGVSLSGSF